MLNAVSELEQTFLFASIVFLLLTKLIQNEFFIQMPFIERLLFF